MLICFISPRAIDTSFCLVQNSYERHKQEKINDRFERRFGVVIITNPLKIPTQNTVGRTSGVTTESQTETSILGDPGAACRDEGIFVGESLLVNFRPRKSLRPDKLPLGLRGWETSSSFAFLILVPNSEQHQILLVISMLIQPLRS